MITQPAGAEQGQTRGFVPRQADEIRPAFLRGLYKVGPAAAFLPAAGGQAISFAAPPWYNECTMPVMPPQTGPPPAARDNKGGTPDDRPAAFCQSP